MVYLTRAELSPVQYDNWICGGAIVSEWLIVTSAACVEDVQFLYAIAGYKKYIQPGSNVFKADECIEHSKKKIVNICVPSRYKFDYGITEHWADIDIAVVEVESAYDFKNPIHGRCSWIPNAINISYDPRHSQPDTDAMVLGWGSTRVWRKPNDTKDYNTETLKYAPVRIAKKTKCMEAYEDIPKLLHTIEKYMICTINPGNIDDKGNIIVPPIPIVDTRATEDATLRSVDRMLRQNLQDNYYYDGLRKSNFYGRFTIDRDNITARKTNSEYIEMKQPRAIQIDQNITRFSARRNGICQNDHGGPLVTWVGSEVRLIGTASVFLVNSNNDCVGPFLYTSTQCSGAFLACVLGPEKIDPESSEPRSHKKRRQGEGSVLDWHILDSECNEPLAKLGIQIIRRKVSWMNHPDGPAANELPFDLFERPQVPLNNFNKKKLK
ncbi:uncharacterized protein LOC113232472 [Hyposmocoma kahamanoa]|uniref:uncharacterized protein LOC113232472 n=1 Tax=Hyposmocoma kahamanoa TaxID=1477025 RepID=UPI000E6D697D|nr:uncharacterized protein LOC113232472 [Hyposmocoma kahamanoa]